MEGDVYGKQNVIQMDLEDGLKKLMESDAKEKQQRPQELEIHSSRTKSLVFLDDETICGIGSFRPHALQSYATIGSFTAFNGAAYMLTSCVASFIMSQITTLERQFGFSSVQTGIILSVNKISYVLCVLIVSYCGPRVHRPRALALGAFTFGFSSILCSLPHFMYNTKTATGDANKAVSTVGLQGQLCGGDSAQDCPDLDLAATSRMQAAASGAMMVFVFGMLIQGLGKGPRFSFAVTYVDDNTEPANTGYYSGIMVTLSVLGPVLSFLVGGFSSQIYVTLEDTDLDPRHPSWIGAWWLGYMFLGTVTILLSFPIFFFPRRLPREYAQEKIIDAKARVVPHITSHSGTGHHRSTLMNIYIEVIEFLSCQFRLFTNPVFLLLNACGAFIVFGASSQSYMAKYLEQVFDLPAHTANYTMAFKNLMATSLGTFLGGYLTRRHKMKAKEALRFTTFVLFLSVIASILLALLFCEQPPIRDTLGEGGSCLANCKCSEQSYFPVCGADGVTYYSPCMAGCKTSGPEQGIFSECDCISSKYPNIASGGACPYGCSYLMYYVICSAVLGLLQTLTTMPRVIIFLRCVGEADKGAGLGLQSFTNSLFGHLTGELLFGYVIDGTCNIWDVTCGVTGRCLRYDNDLLRLRLHGLVIFSTVMSFICVLGSGYYAQKVHVLDEEILEKQS